MTKTLFIILSITIFLGLAYGMFNLFSSDELVKKEKTKIDQCIEMGGLPITSIWDNRLSDCVFKPTENKSK